MRKCIAILLGVVVPFVAFSAESVSSRLQQMQQHVNLLEKNRSQAKAAKELAVVDCLDKKIALSQRLLSDAMKNRQRFDRAIEKKATAKAGKYQERVEVAETRLDKIVPVALRCWCDHLVAENNEALQMSLLGKNRQKVKMTRVMEFCREGAKEPETVVTLKVPEGQDNILENDNTNRDRETLFGFPEIPPASPFR